MSRSLRLSAQDQMMRRDGFVTAVEIAEATGLALSAIHRGLNEERIPGKIVKVSERYSHRYVDIAKYIKSGTFADAKTIRDNLDKLVAAVAEAKAARVGASTPRPTS